MEKNYELRTDKENINLFVLEVRELGLQSDNKDGAKISSTNQEKQPEPVRRALKRIKELKYITNIEIDEVFEPAGFETSENRLTITIEYLDVDDGSNESKVYEENGTIGIKTESMNSNIVRSIDEMSKKLNDLDSKINLKVDTKEFWDFIDYFLEKQQTKVKLNLGSKDYQSIVDAFKQRDEDSVRELY